ncbi:MAG TPA: transcriptional regulator [Mycobacterium sp.]|nr:transcriptional regulator [Mycobacterium sp.]
MHEKSVTRRRPSRLQRLPRNHQRDRVLRLIRENDGPADAAELAGRMGLHVTTVRFHLDALAQEGSVIRTRMKPAGVGRPRIGYIAVRDRMDYRTLAEILVTELGDTPEERSQRAEHAGRRWADRIAANDTSHPAAAGDTDHSIDAKAAKIAKIFDRMGFEPAVDVAIDGRRDRTMRFYGCPVRELAGSRPEICELHRGLLNGLADCASDAEAGATMRVQLDPFVEPEMCVAKVAADD